MSLLRNRRRPLRRLAAVLGAMTLMGAALAACGSDDESSTPDGLDTIALQVNWIMNSTWSGSFMAQEQGYYKDAGLDVEIKTGGPNVDFMSTLASGKALVAFAGFTEPATLNQDGGDYVVVGTMYQKSPLSFISEKADNITKPSDLEGKKVGVSATAQSVWEQFSTTAGIDKSKVTLVPITTGPEALVAGDVDAYLGFITEGPALLAAKGVDTNAFLLQDFGYGYYVDVYTVRKKDLDDPTKRDQIKRFLKADLQGQLAMIKDPKAASELTVSRYGKELGLTPETELSTAKSAAKLFYSPTSEAKGIGYMGGDEMTVAMTTLNKILGTTMPVDGTGYVDMTLLDEIYKEDPEFGKLPPLDSVS